MSRGWRLAPPPVSLPGTSGGRSPSLAAELRGILCRPLPALPRRSLCPAGRGRAVGAALRRWPGARAQPRAPGRAEAFLAGPLPSGLGRRDWCPPQRLCGAPAVWGLLAPGWGNSPAPWHRLPQRRQAAFVNIFLARGTPEGLLGFVSVFFDWRWRKYPKQRVAQTEGIAPELHLVCHKAVIVSKHGGRHVITSCSGEESYDSCISNHTKTCRRKSSSLG